MSVVTNVMVAMSIVDNVRLDEMDAPSDFRPGQRFVRNDEVDEAWGGAKFPEVVVYAAAFNYLDVGGLLAMLAGLAWRCPKDVQVFIQRQDDARFTVLTGVDEIRAGVLPAPEF